MSGSHLIMFWETRDQYKVSWITLPVSTELFFTEEFFLLLGPLFMSPEVGQGEMEICWITLLDGTILLFPEVHFYLVHLP